MRFAKEQRVNVPTYQNVQGVVQHRTDSLVDPTRYGLAWMTGMQVNHLFFTEDEMVAANPPQIVVTAESVDDFGQSLKAARQQRKPAKKKSAKRKR